MLVGRDGIVRARYVPTEGQSFGQDITNSMWNTLNKHWHWHWQGELWNRRKDGVLFAALLSIRALRDADGGVSRYCGCVQRHFSTQALPGEAALSGTSRLC